MATTIQFKAGSVQLAPGTVMGQRAWPSAVPLGDWLFQRRRLFSRALELGAGHGAPGLLLAKEMSVVATDYDSDVLELLEQNAELNNVNDKFSIRQLDWQSEDSMDKLAESCGSFPLVYGSDVIHCSSEIHHVLHTGRRLMTPRSGVLIIAASDFFSDLKASIAAQGADLDLTCDVQDIADTVGGHVTIYTFIEKQGEPCGEIISPFLGCNLDAMYRLMSPDVLSLTKDSVLLDLGCGDGRVLIHAARNFGCRGLGIEIDAKLVEEAQALASDVDELVTFEVGDVTAQTNLCGLNPRPTIVFVHLLPEAIDMLAPVLTRAIWRGLTLICDKFEVPWITAAKFGVGWYLYEMHEDNKPASDVGTDRADMLFADRADLLFG